MVFAVWSGVTYANMMLREVVLEHQDTGNSRWLVWLQCGLNACEVNMQQIQGGHSHNEA